MAAGPLAGRTGAYLTLRDAAGRVEIRLAELPGLLYRITTPPEAGLAPEINGPVGHPHVRLRPTGGDGPDTVRILLNRAVRWDIRLPAGGGEQRLDLRGGRLARVQIGAAGLVVLNLPSPDRAVPVTLSGPVGSCVLAAPAGTALRLQLREGARRAAIPRPGDREAEPGVLAEQGEPAEPGVPAEQGESAEPGVQAERGGPAEPGKVYLVKGRPDRRYAVDARDAIGTFTVHGIPSR